jgi:hypothetical protein
MAGRTTWRALRCLLSAAASVSAAQLARGETRLERLAKARVQLEEALVILERAIIDEESTGGGTFEFASGTTDIDPADIAAVVAAAELTAAEEAAKVAAGDADGHRDKRDGANDGAGDGEDE